MGTAASIVTGAGSANVNLLAKASNATGTPEVLTVVGAVNAAGDTVTIANKTTSVDADNDVKTRVCRILCNRDFGYCRGSLSA